MIKSKNLKEVSSKELLGDEDVLEISYDFIFENHEVIRNENNPYIAEIIDMKVGRGQYQDGKKYKKAEVIFEISDEYGKSEATYTFDLGIAIKSNKRLQALLINTLGNVPIGSIDIKQLLLGKKATIKIKNYTDKYHITTSYITEISQAL